MQNDFNYSVPSTAILNPFIMEFFDRRKDFWLGEQAWGSLHYFKVRIMETYDGYCESLYE
jgi:hypothetical protein